MRKNDGLKCLIVVLLTFVGIINPIVVQQQGDFDINGIVKDFYQEIADKVYRNTI